MASGVPAEPISAQHRRPGKCRDSDKQLPQLGGAPFLTDGGIETTLIFNEGLTLPDFAAFDLLRAPAGVEALRHYYGTHAAIAAAHGMGFILEAGLRRIRGVRANASRRSHAELNEAPELDAGDPVELGAQYADLVRRLPSLNVLGGCCGTDHRQIEAIADAVVPSFPRSEVARSA